MTVSRRVLSRYIAQQLAAGTSRSTVLQGLAAYIVTNKLGGQVEMIVADIARNLAELGTVKADVTVARTLTADLRTSLEAYVKRIEKAEHVEINETIDETLLGGIIVETPSQRFDASVMTQLKRLKNV